jgi:hypothetical protein
METIRKRRCRKETPWRRGDVVGRQKARRVIARRGRAIPRILVTQNGHRLFSQEQHQARYQRTHAQGNQRRDDAAAHLRETTFDLLHDVQHGFRLLIQATQIELYGLLENEVGHGIRSSEPSALCGWFHRLISSQDRDRERQSTAVVRHLAGVG